ncbi:hypothetical protein FJQ98_19255 [Lysinibacillus agricola]|uniref:Uncharacterized protein n=1 Tax=Lysinibacillus agricola TaxID=2590012 RepID=A0ABX7AP68_9BACI|nr:MULTISPECIES: hypothetical protein [Lysinibacillus]KOS61950.1 hypothetical protein AN161_15480 [Lysinibacillus sp. FJAT-14222]QQP11332.1 hypothetical protein FJQ98_19255 [Lysinibacillus agricola]
MEQLIIIAIIAIVSSIFGKSKNKKEQKTMPPFNKGSHVEPPVIHKAEEIPQQRPTAKPQSFEDFAREFLGEWNNEQPKVEESKKIVEETVKEEVPSYAAPPLIPTETVSRTTKRESIGRLAAEKKDVEVAESHSAFQLPTSKKSLMQAIVMAEVLGPPKAKRK